MARVGIDIDGVIFDFQDSLREWILMGDSSLDRGDYPAAERWEFYEDWGFNVTEFVTMCHAAANAGHLFSYGPAMDDAEFQVKRLRDAGHKVIFITDRSFGSGGQGTVSEMMTREWLAKHRIGYDELHFTAQKDTIQVDYMIDDKPENYASLFMKGTDVWIRDRPWNRGFDAYRVASLKRYVDYVLEKQPHGYSPATEANHEEMLAVTLEEPWETVAGHMGIMGPEQYKKLEEEEVRTTSTTGGEKGNKLARFDLIPTSGLWELAELYGQGAIKYADRNWELGYEWSKSYAALQRHSNLFWAGESYDLHKESCLPDCTTHTERHHLASVIFHAMALMEWERTHPEFDDRVK